MAPQPGLIPRTVVTRVLLGLVFALTLVTIAVLHLKHGHGVDQVLGLGPLFDSTRESNVPTWFSSSLMLICAGVVGSIGLRLRRAASPGSWWWLSLAALFCLGSLDETANLHEGLSRLGRRWAEGSERGLLERPWLLFLGPPALVVTAAYVRFFRRQARPVRRAFALGAVVFLGGALGLELVEVALGPAQLERLPMLATMVTQEALEMLGVVAFLHGALLQHELLQSTHVTVFERPSVTATSSPGPRSAGAPITHTSQE